MSCDLEKIYKEVQYLITFLSSLEGEDHERGLSAAKKFEQILRLISSEQGIERLDYAIGGKGTLDWKWSSENRVQIEKFSNTIYKLIHPHA